MLEVLRFHANNLVHRDAVLAALPGRPTNRALDVYVRRLRIALTDTGHRIETVRGLGFILTTAP